MTTQCEQLQVGTPDFGGEVQLPARALGMVVFAHADIGARPGPLSALLPRVLHRHRLGTLEIEPASPETGEPPANGVEQALEWLASQRKTAGLRVGLLGVGSRAAAALETAAQHRGRIGAVVVCGACPDPAARYIARVSAPTLLIVGDQDAQLVRLNRAAMSALVCDRRLEIMPRAGRLFEEPGALESTAHLAAVWFAHHLPDGKSA